VVECINTVNYTMAALQFEFVLVILQLYSHKCGASFSLPIVAVSSVAAS
jgi:hypothetical protein